MKKWLKNKFYDPVIEQLKQGYTVEKVALSLAVGTAIAINPILGMGTAACVVAAIIFKLNHVVIQVANYAAYPIQLALIIPFLSFGQKIFSDQYKSLQLKTLLKDFTLDPILFFKTYGVIALQGFALWLILAPIVTFCLYWLSYWILKPIAKKINV